MLVLGISACDSNPAGEPAEAPAKSQVPDPAHNSRNSIDWFGTYRGTLPCADCAGVKTKLTLYKDDTYRRTIEYLGRDERVYTDEGSFKWSEAGDKIFIDNMDGSRQNYMVGENVLIHLDRQGRQITGNRAELYKLMKNFADPLVEDLRWTAFEINGLQSSTAGEGRRPFITLNSNNGAISGSDGCNALRGEYELNTGNSISLQITASTKMACPDMKSAESFRAMLERAEKYTAGDTLTLFAGGSQTPLAKFTAAEVKL